MEALLHPSGSSQWETRGGMSFCEPFRVSSLGTYPQGPLTLQESRPWAAQAPGHAELAWGEGPP